MTKQRLSRVPVPLLLVIAAAHLSAQGIITTVAGGRPFTLQDGPALESPLGVIDWVARGPAGAIYAEDFSNDVLAIIDSSGQMSVAPALGDETEFGFQTVSSAVSDSQGNLYFVDRGHNIKRLDGNGVITTIVPSIAVPAGNLAIGPQGNFYANSINSVVRITRNGEVTTLAGDGTCGYAGDGGPAIAAKFCNIYGLTVDHDGNVYVMDGGSSRIRRIDTAGMITTVAGNGQRGNYEGEGDGGPATEARIGLSFNITVDAKGDVYFVDGNRIRKFTPGGDIESIAGQTDPNFLGDGGPAVEASLRDPGGLAFDASGALLIADSGNWRVRRIENGIITTVAGNGGYGTSGDGGPASEASMLDARGLVFDRQGNLYFSDHGANRVRKIDVGGTITTVAGGTAPGFAGDGGPAVDALLDGPEDLAVDDLGNLYVADSGNDRVRRINVDGTIETIAGGGPESAAEDGIPATAAFVPRPSGVSFDDAGNLYVTQGDYFGKIRRIDLSGTISSPLYPDFLRAPGHVLATPHGLYFTVFSGDFAPPSGVVYRSDPDGTIERAARDLLIMGGLAADESGIVFVSDSFDGLVYRIDPLGTKTLVAGTTDRDAPTADGVPAIATKLATANGIAFDRLGDLYIATGDRIRRVTACPPLSLLPADGPIGASAGIGGFEVLAAEGCPWTARTAEDWITLTTDRGAGRSPVFYSATTNTDAAPRTGTIKVFDQSFTLTQTGAGSPGGTFEPSLVKRLTPGFYIVEATLAEGAAGGYWGLEVLTSRGQAAGGFNLGGGLSGAGGPPGFGAFLLSTRQTVTATPTTPLAPNADLTIRLLDANRAQLAEARFGDVQITRELDPGFYIVEVEANEPSPIAFSLALSAGFFSGGVNTGGYVGPGMVGFGAFYVPEEQEVTIRLFGKNTYGPQGAESLVLTLKDAGRNVIEVRQP